MRWLDRGLMGRDAGIMDEPMLRVWMQDSVPPQTCYTERAGRWVGEAAWPSRRIADQTLHLVPGGALGGAPVARTAQVCSPLWVGLGAAEIGRYGEDADWAGDQREDDAVFLVFLSQPLEDTYEIHGAPLLRLRLRSDQPQAWVAVRLTEVTPDGTFTRIGHGLLNLTHRISHEAPFALTPGVWIEAQVEPDDIAHSLTPDNRIYIAISKTYWQIAWPSPNRATLTLDLENCALTRPLRPEDAQLCSFDPPESAPQTPSIYHPTQPKNPRKVTRDLLTGKTVVDFPRRNFAHEMTDIGQRVISEGFARFEITGNDPLSAATECGYKVALHRADVVADYANGTKMSCDARHFHLTTWLRGIENGQTIFCRDWQESFPRDNL